MNSSVAILDDREWEKYLKEVPGTTFFHSPAWYQLWATLENKKATTYLFSDEVGNSALLPALEHTSRFGFRKHLISSPRGTYGGFLVKGIFSKTIATQVDHFLHKFHTYSIWQSPFTKQTISVPGGSKKYTTRSIKLDQPWPDILKEWTKGHKSAALKGKRLGINVREAKSQKDWDAYYELYEKSVHRWGALARGQYPKTLFDEIRKLPNKTYKLWLAYDAAENNMLYGCLCFYFNKHVVYWHGAGDEAFFHLKPSHYLQYYIMQDAIRLGYQIYDFNPSGGLSGVEKFKQGFGAKKYSGLCYISNMPA